MLSTNHVFTSATVSVLIVGRKKLYRANVQVSEQVVPEGSKVFHDRPGAEHSREIAGVHRRHDQRTGDEPDEASRRGSARSRQDRHRFGEGEPRHSHRKPECEREIDDEPDHSGCEQAADGVPDLTRLAEPEERSHGEHVAKEQVGTARQPERQACRAGHMRTTTHTRARPRSRAAHSSAGRSARCGDQPVGGGSRLELHVPCEHEGFCQSVAAQPNQRARGEQGGRSGWTRRDRAIPSAPRTTISGSGVAIPVRSGARRPAAGAGEATPGRTRPRLPPPCPTAASHSGPLRREQSTLHRSPASGPHVTRQFGANAFVVGQVPARAFRESARDQPDPVIRNMPHRPSSHVLVPVLVTSIGTRLTCHACRTRGVLPSKPNASEEEGAAGTWACPTAASSPMTNAATK